MKKLFIIIMLFITIGINAQVTTDSTCITDTNVEKLIDKYTDKISVAITSLANSLEQPAEYVFKILVDQQIIIALSGLCIWIFVIIFMLGTTIGYKKAGWDDAYFYEMLFIFSCIGFIITTIIGIVGIESTLTGFFNPEYGAMQDIINIIK